MPDQYPATPNNAAAVDVDIAVRSGKHGETFTQTNWSWGSGGVNMVERVLEDFVFSYLIPDFFQAQFPDPCFFF